MSSKWHAQRVFDDQKDDSVAATEDDLKTTYYVSQPNEYVCAHFEAFISNALDCILIERRARTSRMQTLQERMQVESKLLWQVVQLPILP